MFDSVPSFSSALDQIVHARLADNKWDELSQSALFGGFCQEQSFVGLKQQRPGSSGNRAGIQG